MASIVSADLAKRVAALALDEVQLDGKPLGVWIEDVKRFYSEQEKGKWVEAKKLETLTREHEKQAAAAAKKLEAVTRERDRLREKLDELKTCGKSTAGTVWSMDLPPEKAANVLRNAPTAGVLRRACLMGAEALDRKRKPGRGFYMTDDEIRSSWRRCASQASQVQVLADLNCVSTPTMQKKLQEMGLYQQKEKKKCSTE